MISGIQSPSPRFSAKLAERLEANAAAARSEATTAAATEEALLPVNYLASLPALKKNYLYLNGKGPLSGFDFLQDIEGLLKSPLAAGPAFRRHPRTPVPMVLRDSMLAHFSREPRENSELRNALYALQNAGLVFEYSCDGQDSTRYIGLSKLGQYALETFQPPVQEASKGFMGIRFGGQTEAQKMLVFLAEAAVDEQKARRRKPADYSAQRDAALEILNNLEILALDSIPGTAGHRMLTARLGSFEADRDTFAQVARAEAYARAAMTDPGIIEALSDKDLQTTIEDRFFSLKPQEICEALGRMVTKLKSAWLQLPSHISPPTADKAIVDLGNDLVRTLGVAQTPGMIDFKRFGA